MATKRKATQGGAREGAGRPALFDDRIGITVQLERADHEALAQIANERSASIGSVIREAIEKFLARHRRR